MRAESGPVETARLRIRQHKDDRQYNSRRGFTFAIPITPHRSLKATRANGVTASIGTKFRTIGVACEYLWFDPVKLPAGS